MIRTLATGAENARPKQSKLSFYNLSSKTAQNKPILKQISGNFNSASLVAILGASGAGKTTLLNIISGFSRQNAKWDKLEVDGSASSFELLSNVACYLTQDIHLNDLLTVRENMHFAAEFKLGGKWSQKDKTAKIEELLDSFGLSSALHTRAGALSGGERKRLALAQDMISDPEIIVLDEPTTGLDISTTQQILVFLKKIAAQGKTVICTIHQVTASHLKLFDQIYVMSDGQCAYQGRPDDMVAFLEAQALTCSVYHNPADYIIELCSGDYGPDKSQLLIDAAQNGRAYSDNLKGKYKGNVNSPSAFSEITWWRRFDVLLHREGKKFSRNRLLLPTRILCTNFLAFLVGCVCWDFGNDASKLMDNYRELLMMIAITFWITLFFPVLTLPFEMQLVKRELHNRYYTVLQYYLATFILDLPIIVLTTSTSCMLAWYMSGQPMEIDRVVLYQLFLISLGCVANSVGYFFGTLNLPVVTSLVMCCFSQIPLQLLSGYGLLFKDMHWITQIVSKSYYLRQGVEGATIAMFGLNQRRVACPEEEVYCHYRDTRKFLRAIGLDPDHYGHCFYILFVWFIVVKTLTYFTMRHRLTS